MDFIFLFLLWCLSAWFSHLKVFKILSLVATLEVLAFLATHLLGIKNSGLIQGFLGGFISSTAVFLKLSASTQSSVFNIVPAFLLASFSMSCECLLITYMLFGVSALNMQNPVLVLCLIHVFSILILLIFTKKNVRFEPILNYPERPIVWKNVLKLSLIIIALYLLMHGLGSAFEGSKKTGMFLISFFEAHAVMAASLNEVILNSIEYRDYIFLILFGNAISKSFIALRSKSKLVRIAVVVFMLGSVALTKLFFTFC